MIDTNPEKINEILTRGVEEVFIKKHLEEQLKSGKELRIKLGIDPTSPHIHLGRAVTLRKIKQFQDLGHKIVLIIGDFTAKIGDPSDKLEKRPTLTDEVIQENLKTYLEQIGKIIDIKKTEVRYNSEWLATMNYFEVAKLMENFTVQQMSRRRNFRERLDAGQDIFLIEFMYPALQGYDSVQIRSDVEIGGFDQLFNLQAGRILQKRYDQEEQDVMTLSMLEGTDGRKMSSSWGNIVALLDSPNDMYGKIMSLRDDLIGKYFLLCTDVSQIEILNIELGIQNGDNPMQYKKRLAREIISIYHNEIEAIDAQNNWERTFSEGGLPDNIPEINGDQGKLLSEVLVENGYLESKGEFRRLTDEGGIKIISEDLSEEKITDFQYKLSKTIILKIGKKKFVKIIIK